MDKYYKILEIQPNATEQEVKQAYEDLIKIWHPDRYVNDVRLQEKAEEKIKEINDAYQRIIDHLSQPRNRWICPECLETNDIKNLTCSCSFKTNEIEIKIYRADQTAADLYDTLLFNRSMDYEDRAFFFERYLLRRFPNSKEADIIRNESHGEPSPKQEKPNKELYAAHSEHGVTYLIHHLKKNRGLYIVASLILLVIIITLNSLSNSSSMSELRKYDGKVLFVEEGTSYANHVGTSKIIGPDVISVKYKPAIDKDNLWLQKVDDFDLIRLNDFKKLLNKPTVREATKEEIKNASLCKNKNSDHSVQEINYLQVKRGDRADDIFPALNQYESEKPFVTKRTDDESYFVTHHYVIRDNKYDIFFLKKCSTCPYTIGTISEEPITKLTYKECLKKVQPKE